MNSAFVSYEELWRSRRVLSVITPSSISIILHKIRKPNSLIVNYSIFGGGGTGEGGGVGIGTYLSLSGRGEVRWGLALQFEAGRLLTFSPLRIGTYSKWALIRINTVCRHEKYPGLAWTRTGPSRSHTSRIVLERLAEKIWSINS